jgi:hypothetical protein
MRGKLFLHLSSVVYGSIATHLELLWCVLLNISAHTRNALAGQELAQNTRQNAALVEEAAASHLLQEQGRQITGSVAFLRLGVASLITRSR